jgi:pimeloyl-ACP methyl ester carboxylesterase
MDLQRVPLFIFGKSLGGKLAYNLAIKFPNMFQGLTLVAPFFRHYTDVLDKYKWGYKLFNLVQFYFSFSSRVSRPTEYMTRYATSLKIPNSST